VTALLLGLAGAAAPCQLTTSVGALAVLGRGDVGRPRWRGMVGYLAGKSLVYTVSGPFAVAVGASLSQVSIPVFVAARKALGPLMVIVGVAVAGVLHLRWAPGHAIVSRLRPVARRRVDGVPFVLGVAFGFSFCLTLFALFFGLLIPLVLLRPDGLLYPALFALGTALPLVLALGLLSRGGGSLRRYTGQIGRAAGP
jgi:cytochrome c-type biogenesis protein